MIGYISKYQKAVNHANSQYPKASPKEKKRIIRQTFAKFVVGFATIGKKEGKVVVHKDEPNQGINHRSKTMRPWQ